jgi:hypothetical protein
MIKSFDQFLLETAAVPKFIKPEKLPKVAEMEGRGYRVATLSDGEKYAFSKDYVEQDDIYWLGQNTPEYQYGIKYIATPYIISNKKNLPFYSIYSKCDPSPTDHQKKVLAQREKENAAKQKELQKTIKGEKRPRKRK